MNGRVIGMSQGNTKNVADMDQGRFEAFLKTHLGQTLVKTHLASEKKTALTKK